MRFHVPDMSCGHCTAAITDSIKTLDAGAEVVADLDTRIVTVTSSQPEDRVRDAISVAGYNVSSD
ncbi:heavy-metal-associated domain-containing protein [Primorskyibacter aestuariivivens]|uniref:heavy-metal-associated domain-containing protein n=1 Tax=Primorskyibacter aestuariivivens TaxID=1888912 RepID=UPI00230173F8|nr:heavy-metal-associated domain-containing protein [Primorskyibacter aestuariivivens]MDA7429361.1 heavy-metal-associated domain-containing protein [Primorskyibacter aestuariivivens]